MNPVDSSDIKQKHGTLPAPLCPEEVREAVVRATRDFKNSWRALAKALYVVWENKLYVRWGYEKFDDYTAKEVFVRKHTAMKLIRSYMFLKNEQMPDSRDSSDAKAASDDSPAMQGALSFEAVNTLQRAKRALPQEEYKKIKEDIFQKNKDVNEVKKDLTALILKRRKDVDTEQMRTQAARVAVNRFLAVLRSFRRDVETLDILPGEVGDDIGRLIEKIEQLSE